MTDQKSESTEPLALDTRSEVHDFVRAVRARLVDLTEEEREELAGGLNADMSDLVAERGVESLPDPIAYAAELRSAAGFSAEGATTRGALRERLTARLDRGTATWNRWVDSGEHLGLPEFATSLRPVWWVLRALCASVLLIEVYSPSEGVFGFTLDRALLALVTIALSVQLGRGVWRVRELLRHSLFLRLVLIALNLFALLLVPVMFDRFLAAHSYGFEEQSYQGYQDQNLTFRGNPVLNVYPYDAQGRPLVGVQLVDQDGRRLVVDGSAYDDQTGGEVTLVPWMNGRTKLFSVFPLGQQAHDPGTGEPSGTAALQTPPFSSLPPVTMNGSTPSVLVPPAVLEQQRERVAREAALVREKALRAERLQARRAAGSGG